LLDLLIYPKLGWTVAGRASTGPTEGSLSCGRDSNRTGADSSFGCVTEGAVPWPVITASYAAVLQKTIVNLQMIENDLQIMYRRAATWCDLPNGAFE